MYVSEPKSDPVYAKKTCLFKARLFGAISTGGATGEVTLGVLTIKGGAAGADADAGAAARGGGAGHGTPDRHGIPPIFARVGAKPPAFPRSILRGSHLCCQGVLAHPRNLLTIQS